MSTNISAATSTTKRLQGKVAMITGGASGIGKCSAMVFVKQGAKVVIADVQDELGLSVCKEIGSEETISYVHCDVTCDSDTQNAVDFAVSKFGSLDIMLSNAGTCDIVDLDPTLPNILVAENEDFKRGFDVNVFGAFLAAKHAARVMIPSKKGCILFNSSVASVINLGGDHSYVASKYALLGLAKNLCVELGQYGIRVNCISPFVVVTPTLRKVMRVMEVDKKKIQEAISASANLKEAVLEEEDIAEAAVYLGSDDGINLVVDGGFSLVNPSFGMAMKSLFP
ncbi:secoisolariciresinol dehydrogenase [Manihot esculenta]|uniref:Uncharacterized protein n=1 Tax=Manihot esculenta TaxID=3983 RepID=A0A2C9V7X1_MANES|nr:secoisolariciresinol dehydrogenase [Manihot esculenta]